MYWVIGLYLTAVALLNWFFVQDFTYVGLMTSAAAFVIGKMHLAFYFLQGHKHNRTLKVWPLDMPLYPALYCIFIGGFMGYMIYAAFNETHFHPTTIIKLRGFTITMGSAWLLSMICWRIWIRHITAWPSEYSIWVRYRSEGLSDQQIESKIKQMRLEGYLKPQ